MAEAFVNSICKLIMISGEQDAAPYVGVSAQIDVMQDFMENDMLDVMTGAEDMTQAPELWEAQTILHDSEDSDFNEMASSVADGAEGRGIDPEILGRDELETLIASLKTQKQDGDGKSRIEPVTLSLLIGLGSALLSNPQVTGAISKGLKGVWTFATKVIPGLIRNRAAHWAALKAGAKNLKPTLQNAQTRNALFGSIADGLTASAASAQMMMAQVGDVAAQVAATMQMVGQMQTMSDAMRFFTPSVASLYDSFVLLDDTVAAQSKIESAGGKNEKALPKDDLQKPGDYKSVEDLMAEAANASRDVPKPPATPNVPEKRSVAAAKIGQFTLTDAMRYICRELMILEKEFKVFNSRMAMDKDEIVKFFTNRDPTIATRDIGLGEIMFRALNTTGKQVTSSGVVGQKEVLSFAEQFKQAFPIVDVIDPITKKKSTVSVFELIMQAQNAKVIELGPGFLKWYTELDVLQDTQAVTETPKTGT